MPTLAFGADFEDAFNKLDQLNQKIGKAGEQLNATSKSVQFFNAKGRETREVVTILTGEFERTIKSIEKFANGTRRSTRQLVVDFAAQRAAALDSLRAQSAAFKDAQKSREVFYSAVRKLAAEEAAENKRNAAIFAASQKKRDDAERARFRAIQTGSRGGGGGPTDDDIRRAGLFDGHMNRIQRNLVQFASFRAFNFISNAFTEGIQNAKDFQIQISLIRTLSQDAQQSFGKFAADVREVSDTSGIDVQKVGKAFYDTISNQIAKGSQVKDFVKTATDLARVTGSELPDATNLLSSAINSYGLSVAEADRISAVFFRTIDEGRIVASELANTFGRVGVLGSNLGVSYEELNAVLAITTQKGFKTADAMTLLTNLLIKLEKPTEATRDFFNSLGVNTGEAAIKLYGFTGLLQKMVDAVRSGQVDVSAFFDEIRGRKQFGIFEQSIDDIKRFEKQLKDVASTSKIYKEALVIRGESPADALVKEINKLKNVFTVDLGQQILKFAADLIKSAGGVDALKNSAELVSTTLKGVGVALAGYIGFAVSARIANVGLVTSFVALSRILLPVAAGFAAVQLLKPKSPNENVFQFDPKAINASIEALERLKKAQAALRTGAPEANIFKGLEDQKQVIEDTYRVLLGFIAQANLANNRFLDDAKTKSKEVSEALKVSFAGWLDTLKGGISQIKSDITEARNEIEKSTKGSVKFKDTLDDALFTTRLKFATDDIRLGNQKVEVIQNRIDAVLVRAKKLYQSGNKEEVDQGRALFNELAQLEQQKFDLHTEFNRKIFDENIKKGGIGGLSVFRVETTGLQQNLNTLLGVRNRLEADYVKSQQETIALKEEELKKEEARLRTLQQAFKAYEDLDIFTKTGQVKPEFRGEGGRLSREKVNAALEGLETKIRQSAGGTFKERVDLEIKLHDKRQALFAEAVAQERAEYLKTAETQTITARDKYISDINNIKAARQEGIKAQNELAASLGAKSHELAAFAQNLVTGGLVNPFIQQDIGKSIKDYQASVDALFKDAEKNQQDGVPIYDPVRLEEVRKKYASITDEILKLKGQLTEKTGKDVDLTFRGAEGKTLTPGEGKAAIDKQILELNTIRQKLLLGFGKEGSLQSGFESGVKNSIDAMKASLPGLATETDTATKSMDTSFKNLSNGGLKELHNRLIEVQRLLNQINGPEDVNNESLTSQYGPTYAASGGVVGLFPGQPRGVDRYPIWAAKGETIVDARTSALYRPMLNAIMSRRMPQYMASGGVVGGDTNIGDINVTVTGGSTNSETGRYLGNRLERELRRNNIQLARKK